MMTDNSIPACQFGYLVLTDMVDAPLFIKANQIKAIACGEEDDDVGAFVTLEEDLDFAVQETAEKIFELLEAIHPSLR